MKNENVGLLIIGISILIGAVALLLSGFLNSNTTELNAITGYATYEIVKTQVYIGLAITTLIFILGITLVLKKESHKVSDKKSKQKKKTLDTSKLNTDEKAVIRILQKHKGEMYQASLIEKLKIGKVRTTRLLHKLESKDFVERKRRGMNNLVVLNN